MVNNIPFNFGSYLVFFFNESLLGSKCMKTLEYYSRMETLIVFFAFKET